MKFVRVVVGAQEQRRFHGAAAHTESLGTIRVSATKIRKCLMYIIPGSYGILLLQLSRSSDNAGRAGSNGRNLVGVNRIVLKCLFYSSITISSYI